MARKSKAYVCPGCAELYKNYVVDLTSCECGCPERWHIADPRMPALCNNCQCRGYTPLGKERAAVALQMAAQGRS